MMRKTITRTLIRTTVNAYRIEKDSNGKPKVTNVEPLTVWGKVTEKEAKKALAEMHGKEANVMVANIESVEETYQISIDAFVANATKVETENN